MCTHARKLVLCKCIRGFPDFIDTPLTVFKTATNLTACEINMINQRRYLSFPKSSKGTTVLVFQNVSQPFKSSETESVTHTCTCINGL